MMGAVWAVFCCTLRNCSVLNQPQSDGMCSCFSGVVLCEVRCLAAALLLPAASHASDSAVSPSTKGTTFRWAVLTGLSTFA